jgi:hypothetical protein
MSEAIQVNQWISESGHRNLSRRTRTYGVDATGGIWVSLDILSKSKRLLAIFDTDIIGVDVDKMHVLLVPLEWVKSLGGDSRDQQIVREMETFLTELARR